MKVKQDKVLCIASAPADVDTDDVVKQIREAGKSFQTCIASLEDVLEEPLKGKFVAVKNQINTMLAGLPETDKVPAALASNDVLRSLLYALSTAQMMISNLNDTAKAAGQSLQSTKASMTSEVETAINAKVKSGELIAKAEHDKAINDATTTATNAARTAALNESKVIGARKLALTTASIPLPSDETVLAGEDKDFEAKKAAAAKRVAELKPFKLENDRVLALAWNTDEASYQSTLSLVKKVYESASKSGGVNPFINRDGTGETKPLKSVIGVC